MKYRCPCPFCKGCRCKKRRCKKRKTPCDCGHDGGSPNAWERVVNARVNVPPRRSAWLPSPRRKVA